MFDPFTIEPRFVDGKTSLCVCEGSIVFATVTIHYDQILVNSTNGVSPPFCEIIKLGTEEIANIFKHKIFHKIQEARKRFGPIYYERGKAVLIGEYFHIFAVGQYSETKPIHLNSVHVTRFKKDEYTNLLGAIKNDL